MAARSPPVCATLPPAATADIAALRAFVLKLPIEALCALAPLFDATFLRARRLAERDAALARFAIGRSGSANALAAEVHRDLSRYAASAWRFDQERDRPHDPQNTYAHRVLRLSGGKVPAARSLRKIFTLAKTPDDLANSVGE